MIPKMPAPDLIRGGNRFSEKTILRQEVVGARNELRPVGGAASRNHVPDDGGIGGRVVRGLSIRNTVAGRSAGGNSCVPQETFACVSSRRPERYGHALAI
jgi:hypothetical protein